MRCVNGVYTVTWVVLVAENKEFIMKFLPCENLPLYGMCSDDDNILVSIIYAVGWVLLATVSIYSPGEIMKLMILNLGEGNLEWHEEKSQGVNHTTSATH